MKQRMILIYALLALVALSACQSKGTPTATPTPSPVPTVPPGGVEVAWEHIAKADVPVVARVNGEEITTEAYLAELWIQLHYVTERYRLDWNDEETQNALPGFQDQVLQRVIELRLGEQLAKADNVAVSTAEVEAEAAKNKQQVVDSGQYKSWEDFLQVMGMSEESFLEQTRLSLIFDRLMELHGGSDEAEYVHVAHILVDSEEKGNEVLAKLKEGKDFADLAKEYSIDEANKDGGGELDPFTRGVMVPEFEKAAFALQPGEISGLVKTTYGYHIIKMFNRYFEKIAPSLLAEFKQRIFQAWFAEELAKAQIELLVHFAQPSVEATPTPAS